MTLALSFTLTLALSFTLTLALPLALIPFCTCLLLTLPLLSLLPGLVLGQLLVTRLGRLV